MIKTMLVGALVVVVAIVLVGCQSTTDNANTTTTEDETTSSSMKTYTATELGFRIDYPEDWVYVECTADQTIGFGATTTEIPPCDDDLSAPPVTVSKQTETLTADQFEQVVLLPWEDILGTTRKATTLNGIDAYQLKGTVSDDRYADTIPEGTYVDMVVAYDEGTVYAVRYFRMNGVADHHDVFTDMLETFKFI